MRFFQRQVFFALLIVLVLSSITVFAQDNDTITVAGSGIVSPAFEAIAESVAPDAEITVDVVGTVNGIEAFCNGEADIALSTRALTGNEEANCTTNEVEFYELVMGHEMFALIVNAENSMVTCVNRNDLNVAFPPSVVGTVTDWADLSPVNEDLPLTIVLPSADTSTYFLFDSLVDGDGFRTDAVTSGSDAETIETVQNDRGALGVVNAASLGSGVEGVFALEINNPSRGACYAPTAQLIENGSYPGGVSLYAYVNVATLENEAVSSIANAIANGEIAETVSEAGAVPVTDALVSDMQATLESGEPGRVLSREVETFQITPDISGVVSVGGAASAASYLDNLFSGLTNLAGGISLDSFFEGETAGASRLCAGELDILATESGLSEEALAECEANGVETTTYPLGTQATVLLANENADYLDCLTTDELASIWVVSEDVPTNWSQVSDDMPDAEMILVAPNSGRPEYELLLTSVSDAIAPIDREVTENRNDPLYRAAAVGAVENSLTLIDWTDYRAIVDNGQTGIQLVSVDAGNGCVEPSAETLEDGSYPITRSTSLVVNDASLSSPAVQASLWFVYSDSNYSAYNNAGYVGLSILDFAEIRESLQATFDELAEAQAAQDMLTIEGEEGEDTETTEDTEATDESESDTESSTDE